MPVHPDRGFLEMDHASAHERSATAPFRHEAFRRLWIAEFASNVGTWMQTVGAVWVMIDLKGSPTEVALVQTAATLPVVFLGVFGGAARGIWRTGDGSSW